MAKKKERSNYNEIYYKEVYCLSNNPKEGKFDRIRTMIEKVGSVAVLKKVAIAVVIVLYLAAILSIIIPLINDPKLENFFLEGNLKILYITAIVCVIPMSALVIVSRE